MRFRSIFLVILYFQLYSLHAQTNVNGSIEGILTDSESNEAIANAYVILRSHSDSTRFAATSVNENGYFCLDNIPANDYLITLSCIGYKQKTFPIEIKQGKQVLTNIQAQLTETSTIIDNITVKGQIKTHYINSNKDIIIPDSVMIKNSPNTLELLSKIPGLKTDRLSNTVSILGKENVLVMINGIQREGGISLKSIKPSEIKQIEIINMPTSKFDSEYSGAINIISEKQVQQGMSTDLDLNYYGKDHNESSAQIQYGMKDIRLFGNYSYYLRNHLSNTISKLTNTTEQAEIGHSTYSKQLKNKEDGHFLNYGIDYFINKQTTVNATGDYKTIKLDKMGFSETINQMGTPARFTSDYTPTGNVCMQNYSFYLEHIFKNQSNKITFDYNYYDYRYRNNTDYLFRYFNVNFNLISSSNDNRTENFNKHSNHFKLDGTKALSKTLDLEYGWSLYRQVFENAYEQGTSASTFKYRDDRKSIYGNITYRKDKLNSYLGIRTESSKTSIGQTNNNSILLLPSCGLNGKISAHSNLLLNCRKTLKRPTIEQINPFSYRQDSLTFHSGNPNLKPEYTENLEIRYILNKQKLYFSPTIFFYKAKDVIAQTYDFENNIQHITYNNIGQCRTIGYQLTSSITVTKFLKLNPYLKLEHLAYSDDKTTNKGNSFYYSLSSEISISPKILIALNLSNPGKMYNLQGYYKRNFTIDYIYLNLLLGKGDCSLMIGSLNPLGPIKSKRVEYDSDNYLESKVQTRLSMVFIKLSCSLKFGTSIRKLERGYSLEQDKF